MSFVSFIDLAALITEAKGGAKPPKPPGMLVKINQELQPAINEIFFTPVLVLVEGPEDGAYITTYLHLMSRWEEYRRFGAHIVSAGGKHHMITPLAIAHKLQIPSFVILDSDGDEINPEKRSKHEKDNLAIQNLCGMKPDPFPTDTLWKDNLVAWKTQIGEAVAQDFNSDELQAIQNVARSHCGHVRDLEKNSLFIAEWLSGAWSQGKRSPTLERLCNEILRFAASVTSNHGSRGTVSSVTPV